MGCGHSKINIYPRKYRNKSNNRKSVAPEKTEKAEVEEKEIQDVESDNSDNSDESDQKRCIKVKSFGGPLLAQAEISTSQQDFFKMLDEKIENGPDYNSDSETEKAAESMRLRALLKDWETASASSRSLPVTPKRKINKTGYHAEKQSDAGRPSSDPVRDGPIDRPHISQIPQSVIQQSYGVSQVSYKQVTFNSPSYPSPGQSNQMPYSPGQSNQIAYSPALQYQAISPLYISQPVYPAVQQSRQYANYNQHGSPMKTYANTSKQNYYDQPNAYNAGPKIYGPPAPKPSYSNGELLQQQVYSLHPLQYHQQYKDPREQALIQHQSGYRSPRNYETNVNNVPIVMPNQTGEMNALHRKQYELT